MNKNYFDSNILSVFQEFTEEEFNTISNKISNPVNNKLFRTTNQNPDYTSEDIDILRTREHEWTHYRQHISTHLGAWLFRTNGLKENLTIEFFKQSKILGVEYNFKSLIRNRFNPKYQKDELLSGLLLGFNMLLNRELLLWNKTAPLKHLKTIWNISERFLVKTDWLFCSNGYQIDHKRDSNEETCPNGSITVIDLIEGYAKFKELTYITSSFSIDEAQKIYLKTFEGVYTYAYLYFRQFFDLDFSHPLVGAMLELAILSFVDPNLSQSEQYYWDDIHPGLRFMKACNNLNKHLIIVPDNLVDIYEVAMKSYGFFDEHSAGYQDYFYNVNIELRKLKKIPSPVNIKSQEDFHSINQYTTKFSFLNAIKLREENPLIYFNPQLYRNTNVFDEFLSITRPIMLVEPKKIFIPQGAGRDMIPCIFYIRSIIQQSAIYEISHYGRLSETINLARRYLKSENQVFKNKEEIREFLKAPFYGVLDNYINSFIL